MFGQLLLLLHVCEEAIGDASKTHMETSNLVYILMEEIRPAVNELPPYHIIERIFRVLN